MEEKDIQLIMGGNFKTDKLIYPSEKEKALKILTELDGVTIIRAISILNFCQEALLYNVSNV